MPTSKPVGERASIYRRGSTWWVNVQLYGRQVRRSLRTRNEKEARRRAIEFERVQLNGFPTTVARDKQPMTVREASDALLTNAAAEGRAPKTLSKYTGVFNRLCVIVEGEGKLHLVDLDHGFIDDYRKRRTDEGASPKTVYNEVVLIRQLVNFAMKRRLLPYDPLAGLQIREPKPTPQPCWTPDQEKKILQAASEPQRSVYTFLSETGARIGEVKWLTWNDVDFANNVIHIRPKDGWTTKTGNIRVIPLTDRARSVLLRLPRRARWVFTAPPSRIYPDGTHQISERRLLKSLKRLLKRLKLSGHLHTFRHCFISRAVVASIPEAMIRKWVGHVDTDILRLYTHLADSQSQAAMMRMNLDQPS